MPFAMKNKAIDFYFPSLIRFVVSGEPQEQVLIMKQITEMSKSVDVSYAGKKGLENIKTFLIWMRTLQFPQK